MRIVVIGGQGFIGARLVDILRARGHDVIAEPLAVSRRAVLRQKSDLPVEHHGRGPVPQYGVFYLFIQSTANSVQRSVRPNS